MGSPNPHQLKLVAEVCRQFSEHGNRTLAKMLQKKHPQLFTTFNQAYCAVRYHRGNRGKQSHKSAVKNGSKRENAIGTIRPLPESLAEAWVPFVLDAKRVLVLSDLHVPFHDATAIEAALEYGESFKPDAVLINGDMFDFYQLSRFQKDPTKPGLLVELRTARAVLEHITDRLGVPILLKLGNHDERFANYVFLAAPTIAELEDVRDAWRKESGINDLEIQVIGDQRPIMLGKLPVFHGHELGKGISNPVNPARGAFLRAHHTILVGHSHQTSGHADTNVWHDETFCWSTGCLCDLTPEYARINRWNQGAATVVVHDDGSFDVVNFRISKGSIRTS